MEPSSGPLRDGPGRDYNRKVELFQRFAEPELRAALAWAGVRAGARVLDAGCGAGLLSAWLAEAVAPGGTLRAIDISEAHADAARAHLAGSPVAATVEVADLAGLELPPGSVDLIWCSNTLNHLTDPVEALRLWLPALAEGGRVAIGQSSFLPEMVFAWDARLEAAANQACRACYRERYGLTEESTTAVRNLLGFFQRAGYREVTARTFMIERSAPLTPADRDYLLEAVFRGYWGEKIRSYLEEPDWLRLERLCDPGAREFALDRPDFHFLMTYSVAVGMR